MGFGVDSSMAHQDAKAATQNLSKDMSKFDDSLKKTGEQLKAGFMKSRDNPNDPNSSVSYDDYDKAFAQRISQALGFMPADTPAVAGTGGDSKTTVPGTIVNEKK